MNVQDAAIGGILAVATLTMGTAASVFGYLAFATNISFGGLSLSLFFLWTAMTAFMIAIDIVLLISCLRNVHRRRERNGDIPLQPEQRPLFQAPPTEPALL